MSSELEKSDRYYVSQGCSAKIGKEPVTYKLMLYKGLDNYVVILN